jgi:predicted TIM-barrel fold metal-dependent hydrolase
VIVDVHTHTPTHRDAVPAGELRVYDRWLPDRSIVTTRSWEEYAEAFEEVDISIVFNIAVPDPLAATGLPTDPTRINESTAEFVADDPGRRIGFLSVNPDDPGAIDEIERCQTDLGLLGIKLGPNYQRFDPLSSRAHAVYEVAAHLGMPIMFHQGTSPVREAPLRYAHPLLMDEIAIRHPELRVVMAHMGHPWQRDTIVVIRKHPNVFADVSAGFFRPWSFYEAMLIASEWGVLGKLLLGSDYPVATPAQTIEGLRGVNAIARRAGLPEIPADEIEEIIHRDALALLGLPSPT